MPYVDMESSRRLAYAFIEPPCADPGLFIRVALEQRGGDPPVRLAPSSHDSMMVVFGHTYFREMAVRRGVVHMGGHRLFFVRHEEADFRVAAPYTRLVEITATNPPSIGRAATSASPSIPWGMSAASTRAAYERWWSHWSAAVRLASRTTLWCAPSSSSASRRW